MREPRRSTKAEQLNACFLHRETKSSASSENSAVKLLLLQKVALRTGSLTQICFPGCALRCRAAPLELVFVIDGSESVGPRNFELVKDFVNALIDRLAVSREAARIGVVLYSHVTMVVASLQQRSSQSDLKASIRTMQYLGEGTFTGSAIHRANQLFQASRPGVRKVALVLTDGQADPRDLVQVDVSAAEAHARGIETFVIGVMNETDPLYRDFSAEMKVMASDPDEGHVYLIHDFSSLHGRESPFTTAPPAGPRRENTFGAEFCG